MRLFASGFVAAWFFVLGSSGGCSGDVPGACTRDTDCPANHRCDPGLGCVPGGGGSDGDADSDADADAVGDDPGGGGGAEPAGECAGYLEACRRGGIDLCRSVLESCPELASCDDLQMMCELQVLDACQRADERGCDGVAGCGPDGQCYEGCQDPDCGDVGGDCPNGCGDLPASAREHCTWACEVGRCLLVPFNQGSDELCGGADGPQFDEDCDGLVDCADPDCQNDDACL